MHELFIIEGVIKTVEARREKHGFSRVRRVDLVCGKYSCLAEENLTFCFDAVTGGTFLEGARLTVTRLPGRFSCAGCGAEFGADDNRGEVCPSCGSRDVFPEIDQGVYISKIEVD